MEKYVIHYAYDTTSDTTSVNENFETDDYNVLLTKVNTAFNSAARVDIYHSVDGRNNLICSNDKLLDLSEHDKYWAITGSLKLMYDEEVVDYIPISIFSEVNDDNKICIIASIDIIFFPNGKSLENLKKATTGWMDKYLPAVRHQYGNYILRINMSEKVTMK